MKYKKVTQLHAHDFRLSVTSQASMVTNAHDINVTVHLMESWKDEKKYRKRMEENAAQQKFSET